jgi:DNA-binding transcriptional ArsR family regulator
VAKFTEAIDSATTLSRVVKYHAGSLDALRALADPARLSMLERLSHGEASVTELAAPGGASLPATLKHVRVLERAGLLAAVKRGRVRYCRLRPEGIAALAEWVEERRRTWDARLRWCSPPATPVAAPDPRRWRGAIAARPVVYRWARRPGEDAA